MGPILSFCTVHILLSSAVHLGNIKSYQSSFNVKNHTREETDAQERLINSQELFQSAQIELHDAEEALRLLREQYHKKEQTENEY